MNLSVFPTRTYGIWRIGAEYLRTQNLNDQRQRTLDQQDDFVRRAGDCRVPLTGPGGQITAGSMVNALTDRNLSENLDTAASQIMALANAGMTTNLAVAGIFVGPSRFTFNLALNRWQNVANGQIASSAQAALRAAGALP